MTLDTTLIEISYRTVNNRDNFMNIKEQRLILKLTNNQVYLDYDEINM